MPHQAYSSASTDAPRKMMRKGTRSCFECRRRKKRCIFPPDDPSICITCKNKGFRCMEQKPEQLQYVSIDNRLNLKDRVAKLEAIIQALAPGGDSRDGTTGDISDTPLSLDKVVPPSPDAGITSQIISTPASDSEPLGPDIGKNIGPIASLFNNAIWRSSDSDESVAAKSRIEGNPLNKPQSKTDTKHARTREALLSRLPAPELLGDILNATCSWWYTWRPLGHSISEKKPDSLQEFVVWAFNSENPSIVGLAILCVSVSIQQLSTDNHEQLLRRLPRPPGELVQEYFTQVDALIANDSDYASTIEGVEVILMSAKTLMNLGLIKKAWVLYHRAISYCQFLGLHRPQRLFEKETDKEIRQRNSSWVSICRAEVYLSLLLGLPYASDCRTIPVTFYGDPGTTSMFGHHLLRLSVQVIDRNQMGLSLSTELADQMQFEVDLFKQVMPAEFWNCETALADGKITKAEYFERITSNMWYHQLKVSLHMPLMIQSVEDHTLELHRLACLESCRDLLRIYGIMRSDKTSAFNMIKLIDYQAFICASLLILGILGYGTSPSMDQSMRHIQDQDLVDATTNILRQAARTSNNNIASQALQGLETLSLLPKMNCEPAKLNEAGQCAVGLVKIVVPYAGIVTISAGEFLQEQRRQKQSSQQSILNPLPVFTLSHGILHSYQEQNHPQTTSEAPNIGLPDHASANIQDGTDSDLDIPFIDFDWGGMVNMRAADDWAWLNDVNNGSTGFI